MKNAVIITAIMLFCSARTLVAGEMFGTITEGAKPVGEKVKVEVTASGKAYTADTDKSGGYRLFVKEKGKCSFTVHYKDQDVTADVFSYDRSLRYDWVLEAKDGKYTLKRK